jgi:hypothetical protein
MTAYMLDDLTFDKVKAVFPNIGNWPEAISFPNPDDSLLSVSDENDLEGWKEGTKERYGNVKVALYPNATVWYDKVKILDDKFIKDKQSYSDAKGGYLDNERSKGRTYGLD